MVDRNRLIARCTCVVLQFTLLILTRRAPPHLALLLLIGSFAFALLGFAIRPSKKKDF